MSCLPPFLLMLGGTPPVRSHRNEATPVRTCAPMLVEASPSPADKPTTEKALLGRQREIEVLDRLLDDVRGGASRALVIRGEPGVGKTALLDYLQERGPGRRGGG